MSGVSRDHLSELIIELAPMWQASHESALRTEGIAECFGRFPDVQAEVDEGYRGLANEFPDQISAPPKPMTKKAWEKRAAGRAVRPA